MTTLYYALGTCSIGIHILLEEIGKPYSAQKIDLTTGAQYQTEFVHLNPKSRVPLLIRDDGSSLTEFSAIALWLALTNPEKKLWPQAIEQQVRCLEAMDYIIATIHMQGFKRIFRPSSFFEREEEHEKIRDQGKKIISEGFELIEQKLKGQDFLVGSCSIADFALFYIELWAARRSLMKLPPSCATHFENFIQRSSTRKIFEKENIQL